MRGFHGENEKVGVWLGGPCTVTQVPRGEPSSLPTGRREAQRGGDRTGRVKRSQRQQLRGRTAGSRETETKRDRHRITLQARCYSQPWNAIDDRDANSASRWTGGVALERRDLPLCGRRGAVVPLAGARHAIRRDALLDFSGGALLQVSVEREWRID